MTHIDLVEREVGLDAVTWTLDVGIPPWLKVVHYEMEATNGWSCDGDAPAFFPEPMNRVKGFVGFASISGNDQYR